MISRCSFFIDMPFFTNVLARYSSSSGFVGRSPVMPKLLGVSTIPVSKCAAPDAIHDHSHGERLFHDLLSQFQPAAPLAKGFGSAVREHAQEVARQRVSPRFSGLPRMASGRSLVSGRSFTP